MAKRSKRYRAGLDGLDREKEYAIEDAAKHLKRMAKAKFDESIDISVNLGVDPRHADQNVRGTTLLPNGSGKSVRIVVFAKGEKAQEATEEGVDFVGADDLVQKINEGWMDFDQVIATPDMMGQVGRLGKVLGPRGLMPNPKLGTVTFEVKKAIQELKAGRTEFRVDKNGIVHCAVGKASFSEEQITQNISAVVEALVKAKPSTSKGTYLKKLTVSTTMSPGVRVDVMPFRA